MSIAASASQQPRQHYDLSAEIFQKYGCDIVSWIANYLENMDEYPVLSPLSPGAVKEKLPSSPPLEPDDFATIWEDFQNIILPGITHWNHPRFFAYFSITGSYPGIIGELLASALNVNAMLWKTSPAATELEEVVLNWLRQMVGLPAGFVGVINDTASVGSLCAMAAAREYANLQIREQGLCGRQDLPRLRMYASAEAHSSIEKAAIVLGLGQQGLRKIPPDDAFRMDVAALQQAIQEDQAAGIRPLAVIATIGTTSTTSIDPVARIADLCEQHGLWLHVDAAYGGAAAVVPELRPLFQGWELADSIIINPHKWLFTPIDCSVLFCRRPEVLKRAFSLTPEYLRTSEADAVTNYMDFGVALGRRFRALKLWLILRALGQNKIETVLREHISWAQRLARLIESHPNFRLMAPVPFSTVVFQFRPVGANRTVDEINALNEKLLETLNATGRVFLSHTKLRGEFGIRLAIGNIKTTWDDVATAWEIIQKSARDLV